MAARRPRRARKAPRRQGPRGNTYEYPAAHNLMPGAGAIAIPHSPQPPTFPKVRGYRPRVLSHVVRTWLPHPVSVQQAQALGDLYGRGINGQRGTIATEASRNGAGAVDDPSVGFAGYGRVPHLFTGWNPAAQPHTGTVIKTPGGLPDTSLPAWSGSPLQSAMAQIFQGTQ